MKAKWTRSFSFIMLWMSLVSFMSLLLPPLILATEVFIIAMVSTFCASSKLKATTTLYLPGLPSHGSFFSLPKFSEELSASNSYCLLSLSLTDWLLFLPLFWNYSQLMTPWLSTHLLTTYPFCHIWHHQLTGLLSWLLFSYSIFSDVSSSSGPLNVGIFKFLTLATSPLVIHASLDECIHSHDFLFLASHW